MNKRLIISLSVIGVVAAIAIGGTIAYFNDTETSSGNIFVAGGLDLKVDHVFQSYNGNECEEFCEVPGDPQNLVLNGSFEVPEVTNGAKWDIFPSGYTGLVWTVEWVGNTTSYGGYTRPDPSLAEYHEGVLGSAYEGDQYTELDSDWYGPGHPQNNEPASVRIWQDISTTPGAKYRVQFAFAPRPSTGTGDNQLKFSWNGSLIDTLSGSAGSGPIQWSVEEYDVTASGATTRIEFADAGTENSLGTFLDDVRVYELDCDYSLPGAESCELWEETDLTEQTFFDFYDVKPGDFGRNVISMHVYDNDAWTCLIIDNINDDENQVIDPEIAAGDDEGSAEGELGDYLEVFAWNDKDQDGLYDPSESEDSFAGPDSFFDVVSEISLHDSTTDNGVLVACETEYIGLAWCAGTLTVEPDGSMTCDGSTMGDIAQTDILTADLTAFAEQWRNNSSFDCSQVNLGE
jgi:predicted ribosomally synthesized peptide with SipW-like signal peptide